MHDWWLALLASSCGTTGFLDEATIDYRQHGSNSVGASNARSLRFMVSRLTDNSIAKSMRISFEQAQSFEKCFSTVMPEKYRHTVNAYASLSHRGWLARKVIYFQYSFWKQGRTKQIGQILFG